MFETPLIPRTVPVVDDDVAWEDYEVLDPVGAAQARAEWWAVCQGLEPCGVPGVGPGVGPDVRTVDGPAEGAADELSGVRVPAGTAAVAAAVADLHGPALASFLAGLPPEPGVDGATVVEAITGFEKVIRWAQARQLRWVHELACRREDGRTGWARDDARGEAPQPSSQGPGHPDVSPDAAQVEQVVQQAGQHMAQHTEQQAEQQPAVQTGPQAGPQVQQQARLSPGEDLLGRVGEHAAAEVAFALSTSRRAATDLLYAAVTLTRRLPRTLVALEGGQVSARAAAVVAEETCVLDAAAVAAVDEALTDRIPGRTVPQTRATVRRAVLSVDPAAAAAREVKARRCRSFDVDRQVVDGMGTFGGYAPIADVVAIDERVTALARAARTPGDNRTPGARRMDVVVDLLLGRQVTTADGTVICEPPPPRTWRVDVVVSAATLAGHDEQPGDLTGYGPIPAPTARRLAGLPPPQHPTRQPLQRTDSTRDHPTGHASADEDVCASVEVDPPVSGPLRAVWRRLVTDPVSGTVRDYGTTRYRPPTALADLVRARDRYCYAPGCRQASAGCDLDHLANSPVGPSPRPDPTRGTTAEDNLAPACAYHHRVKARPGWRVTTPAPGAYTWTTPTGHTYQRPAEPPLDAPVYTAS